MNFTYKQPSVQLSRSGCHASATIAAAVKQRGVRTLAKDANLSPTTVSAWINGGSKLPWETAVDICKLAGVEHHLWTATMHDRRMACFHLGFEP